MDKCKAGIGSFGSEFTRCFFSLFGEGETGSPRRRFRALETAETGSVGDSSTAGSTNGSKSARFAADFVGVAKGFRRDGSALFLPLFFTGEKGLNVASGAVVSATRGAEGNDATLLGGVEGAGAAAAASFARRL